MVHMSKEFTFFFQFVKYLMSNLWKLNVNVTKHNSCNHTSLHLWLQSLELAFDANLMGRVIGKMMTWLEKVGNWGTWFPENLVIWREIYEFETKIYIRNVGKYYQVPGKSNIFSSHEW